MLLCIMQYWYVTKSISTEIDVAGVINVSVQQCFGIIGQACGIMLRQLTVLSKDLSGVGLTCSDNSESVFMHMADAGVEQDDASIAGQNSTN